MLYMPAQRLTTWCCQHPNAVAAAACFALTLLIRPEPLLPRWLLLLTVHYCRHTTVQQLLLSRFPDAIHTTLLLLLLSAGKSLPLLVLMLLTLTIDRPDMHEEQRPAVAVTFITLLLLRL
jgi:hypothetical protein